MKAKIVTGKTTYLDYVSLYCKISGIDDPALLTDSQDLSAIIDHFGVLGAPYGIDNITGALVTIGEGDYTHIWLSWARTPYANSARYRHYKVVLY